MSVNSAHASILLIWFMTLALVACQAHTSDDRLEALFRRNESSFVELARMLQSDPRIQTIDSRYVLTDSQTISLWNDPAGYQKVFTRGQWEAYQSLFRKLGLEAGVKVYKGRIYFGVDAVSLLNGDSEKGIVHCDCSLQPTLSNLAKYRLTANQKAHTVYRFIKPGWYVYLAVN